MHFKLETAHRMPVLDLQWPRLPPRISTGSSRRPEKPKRNRASTRRHLNIDEKMVKARADLSKIEEPRIEPNPFVVLPDPRKNGGVNKSAEWSPPWETEKDQMHLNKRSFGNNRSDTAPQQLCRHGPRSQVWSAKTWLPSQTQTLVVPVASARHCLQNQLSFLLASCVFQCSHSVA